MNKIPTSILFSLLSLALSGEALADNFRSVSFDQAADEVVVEVAYRGTNPDHVFTIEWGKCQATDDGSLEASGDLLDQDFQDAARNDYTKTVRFKISDLECRPATITIRTAPHFFATVRIPALPPTSR